MVLSTTRRALVGGAAENAEGPPVDPARADWEGQSNEQQSHDSSNPVHATLWTPGRLAATRLFRRRVEFQQDVHLPIPDGCQSEAPGDVLSDPNAGGLGCAIAKPCGVIVLATPDGVLTEIPDGFTSVIWPWAANDGTARATIIATATKTAVSVLLGLTDSSSFGFGTRYSRFVVPQAFTSCLTRCQVDSGPNSNGEPVNRSSIVDEDTS